MGHPFQEVNAPFSPGIDMRWCQDPHSLENVNRTNVPMVSQSGFRRANDPPFQRFLIIWMQWLLPQGGPKAGLQSWP